MFKMNLVEQIKHGKLLYPAFSLSIQKGDSVALYAESEIRSMIIERISKLNPNSKKHLIMDDLYKRTNDRMFNEHIYIHFYDDGLYDRLTVLDHVRFFKKLSGSHIHVDTVLDLTMLQEKRKHKISQLTFSEQKRVHFCRILLHDASLYVLEEPDVHVDIETKQIFLQLLETLQTNHKYVLILTSNLEHAITATSNVFRIDQHGCKQIQMKAEEENNLADEQAPFQFDKIPTRVEDKILLFDPFDIDYIESIDGQAFLHVKGDSFPTTFTLVQLEKRLQPFGFFRCHRSYIVNLQKVKEVITWTRNSFNLILDDFGNTSIPLSKSKMSKLKEIIGLP